jgi:hypothetical protein
MRFRAALLATSLLAFPAFAQTPTATPRFEAQLAGHAALPAMTLVQPPADAPALFRLSGRFASPNRERVEQPGAIPTTTFTADASAPRGSGQGLPLAGQPAQGISGLVPTGPGAFLLLSDNGYGNRVNSVDSLLMVHRATADWRAGRVSISETVFLRDPDKRVPFAIRNEATAERYLTGADFDPESLAVVGDRWFIGDEFGPYIIETDASGRVLAVHETQVEGRPARSPDHHMLAQLPNVPGVVGFNVRRSRGFEPMAATPDGQRLIAMFEGPLVDPATGQPETHAGAPAVRMLEFDVATRRWTGRQWRYRLEDAANVIGDLAMVDATTAVLIERDDASEGSPALACNGPARPDCFNRPAAFKRVYRIDLANADADGFVRKLGWIDLMDIADPEGVAHAPREPNGRFALPFQGPEGIAVVDADHIAVVNDNNLPFNSARRIGQPDDSEIALLRVPEFLRAR